MACRLFDSKLLSKTIPSDLRKATKFIIASCSAIWYEAQQQCWSLTYSIWNRTYVLFVYLIMDTCLDKHVYRYIRLYIYAQDIHVYMQGDYVQMYT